MRQWKLYLFVTIGLLFLVFATLAACSQPSPAVENTPALKPAEFEVGPISIEPPVIMAGDPATVTTTVKNIGDIAGNYNAALSVDGQGVDSKVITVDPGNSQEVSFQLSQTAAGSHQLALGSSSAVLTVLNWSPYAIQYDESDGVGVGIYVGGDNGHIVHFTPANKVFKIQKIEIYGFAKVKDTYEFDKNHVTVRIWDNEGNNQLWSQDFPWRSFIGGSWLEIKVPDIRVNDDFEVEIVTYSKPAWMSSIDFLYIDYVPSEAVGYIGGVYAFQPPGENIPSVICIGFDYPQSCAASPINCPKTRSGYSYMGKPIDPGEKRLEGINWLIRVEGEGAVGN